MKIYPVILSGGAGTRLWPLSRAVLPKQLLPLVSDKTMRISFSTLGRLISVRRMNMTCWSRFGSVVIPDNNGFRILCVSTYTRADASYWFGSLYTTVHPTSATIHAITTACQRYLPIAFRKERIISVFHLIGAEKYVLLNHLTISGRNGFSCNCSR